MAHKSKQLTRFFTNKRMQWLLLYSLLPLTVNSGKYCQLVTDILKNYVKDVRPICGKDPIVVYIDFALRQLQAVNEQQQILSINAWLRLGWSDCNLSWNMTHYDGIKEIYLPEEKIWFPDICLYDNAEYMLRGLNEYYRVKINSSGYVQYNFPSQLQTSCNLNVKYFPFDVQTCNFSFGSWSYHDSEITMMNEKNFGDRSRFLVNGEWELIDFSVTRITEKSSHSNTKFSTIVFQIRIQRKPAVHLLNLIYPSILVSAIGLLGFFIPSESGEKISISVTVLLSLAVFHLVISETLPNNSDSLPYLSYLFLGNMVFVGLCCTMSIVVLNIHHIKADKSVFIRIIRYLKAKRKLMKIANKSTYDLTQAPPKHTTMADANTNGEYVQTNAGEKQQRSDHAIQQESLFEEIVCEMKRSCAAKRKAEELKAEITTIENYVNRFFMILAIITFLILFLIIINLSEFFKH